MGQVNAGGFHKVIGVVKHIQPVAVVINGVANFNEFCEIKGFGAVCHTITIFIRTAAIVFIVIIPLSNNKSRIIGLSFCVFKLQGNIIRWIIFSGWARLEERISIILEVE